MCRCKQPSLTDSPPWTGMREPPILDALGRGPRHSLSRQSQTMQMDGPSAQGLGAKAALSCTLTDAGRRRFCSAAAAATMALASASDVTSVPLAGNTPASCTSIGRVHVRYCLQRMHMDLMTASANYLTYLSTPSDGVVPAQISANLMCTTFCMRRPGLRPCEAGQSRFAVHCKLLSLRY